MSLHDLHAVFVSTQNACKSINACGNLSLSKEFKKSYADLIKNEPSFSRHNEAVWLANDILELHSRGNRTVTYIPSVFFFVAQKLVPLYLELQTYRAVLVQVLQQYNHTLDDTEESNCVQYIDKVAFLSDEEKHWLCKFVTDGSWWGKGRQIKRAQDFYESPLMQCASLTQETQSEVARITKQFAENPELVSKLAVAKNLLAEEQPKVDRLTIALKLFAEQRATWRAAMDKNKGPTYQFVNADVRAFFGKKENWDVEKLKGAEGFEDFCLHHTWMLSNGKAWPSLSHYDDAERVKLVDWIDEKIVKGNAALQNVIVDDNGLKGFTNKAVSELLMKFHPESYILCNGPTVDSLKFLRSEWAVKENYSYADYLKVLGAAAVIRDRMAEMKIYATIDGNTPPDFLAVNEFIFFVSENKDLIKEEIMASTYKKTEIKKIEQKPIGDFSDFIKKLEQDVADTGLKYADGLMKRFVCAQLAKPFVVLTGLSGSGKTKLAEAFTKWIGVENTVNIVPVGADWTNNEKLLGYPNALDSEKYVMPDTGVLKLMLDANENPDLPFFLILDEMNLSHVERYFADFLSTMESNDGIIELYDSGKRYAEDGREIPPSFTFPKNLFVIGTMNVDETTYMFSPKVLDRAQVIEFRVKDNEMADFVGHFDAGNNWVPGKATQVDLSKLADANGVGKGAKYAESFLELCLGNEKMTPKIPSRYEKKPSDQVSTNPGDPANTIPLREIAKELNRFFPELAKLGAEFGYRSASEIMSFCGYYIDAGATVLDAIDAAIMQKLLPKMHGSQLGLMPTVDILLGYASEQVQVPDPANPGQSKQRDRYPMSKQKLETMKTRLETNGFASFAEA